MRRFTTGWLRASSAIWRDSGMSRIVLLACKSVRRSATSPGGKHVEALLVNADHPGSACHFFTLDGTGADFSVRSSVRIEETRISQTRCLESVFLLSYSRLRSSHSTWICSPLVSVLANSESLPNTTQRCHSVCEVYPPFFL